jgi:hypothetical protein
VQRRPEKVGSGDCRHTFVLWQAVKLSHWQQLYVSLKGQGGCQVWLKYKCNDVKTEKREVAVTLILTQFLRIEKEDLEWQALAGRLNSIGPRLPGKKQEILSEK